MLFIIGILMGIPFAILFFIYWDHRKETLGSTKIVGRAKYSDFKRRFSSLEGWGLDANSYFNIHLYKDNVWYAWVGQSKIVFNKRAMLMGPIDYFRVRLFVICYLFKLRKNTILKWEDVEAQEMMENITEK